jgi:hypothetical protein
MIRNIKIHNILDIIEISKYMEPNKIMQIFLWKCSFKCFLWFFKVQWVQENQGVTILVVPPNDKISQHWYKCVGHPSDHVGYTKFV